MPGQRGSGSRSRRSWLPVLAGAGAIVLVAGIAAVTYAVTSRSSPPAPTTHVRLPTKVASTDTVGLAGYASGPGTKPGQLVQLLAQQGSTGFFRVSAAENASGQQSWTADSMSDGTYIFIYLPTAGMCLSATGSAGRPALGLRHCVAAAAEQRWRRIATSVVEAGHDFYEFANVADGKCISQTGAAGQSGSAGLASCDTLTHPVTELLAFWWTTIQ